MNQILFTQNDKSNNPNNKVDIKIITIIFSIVLIVFAVIAVIIAVINSKRNTVQNSQDPDDNNYIYSPIIDEYEDPLTPVQDDGEDKTNPKIEFSNPTNNHVTVIVTDETELEYMTYRWNEEEEKKIFPSQENMKKITEEIEVLRGQNKLTVLAVDKAGNQYQSVKTYEGITKPYVNIVQDGNDLVIRVKDEEELDYVYYVLNGKEFKLKIQGGQKEIEYRQAMDEGENRISLQAFNVKEGKTVYEGVARNN